MWDVCQAAVFEGWWGKLSEQEQDDVTAIVELLQEMCPQLPFPHSSGVESSRHSHMLRELRIQSHDDPQGGRALRRSPQQPAIPTQAMTRSFS
jgi:hypothetical protein